MIGLVDCAGLRLQEATDALDGFGKLYLSQTMASGVIPQIMAILVPAAAVWLLVQVWQISLSWKILLQNCLSIPQMLWRATIRQNVILLLLSSSQKNPVWLILAGDEASVLSQIRTLVSILPSNNEEDLSEVDCTDDLKPYVHWYRRIYRRYCGNFTDDL